MESPAAPAASPGQQAVPGAAIPAGTRPSPVRGGRGILRYPLARQLVRFAGVGAVCTLASLALYVLLRAWIGPQPANAAALVITSVMNTALNHKYQTDLRGAHYRSVSAR